VKRTYEERMKDIRSMWTNLVSFVVYVVLGMFSYGLFRVAPNATSAVFVVVVFMLSVFEIAQLVKKIIRLHRELKEP
jgi:hypothetical protein